ncbi:MAG: hypothetical protein AAF847_05960 [Bacteroidota bacterium]
MFTKNELAQLRRALAKYTKNSYESISIKTDLSRTTISKFFNGKPVKSENALKIFSTTVDLIREGRQDFEDMQQTIRTLDL